MATNKSRHLRTISESSSHAGLDPDQRHVVNLERYRSLSAKVERCLQEIVERIHEQNPTLNFELLVPPASHLTSYLPNENKEFYFDFYLVWKNFGRFQIEKDDSSICCKIKYLNKSITWSRAEQDRLLITQVNKTRSPYINGRGLRDLFHEALCDRSLDLIRLDFIEYLIYFDLIIPSAKEKTTCHVSLLPCIHIPEENEVLLPYGTLRWYQRSLRPISENNLNSYLQQPLQNISIRRYLSTNETVDTSAKCSRQDQLAFARARAIIHELLLPCTLEHCDSMELLRSPFDDDLDETKKLFFIPHRTDRNCNVFPAGQYLLDDPKAKRFVKRILQINTKIPTMIQRENSEVKA
ncbi:unnamed protein product [Adineta ricciae]|uniref:Uncharacterized protein n=1 Tax=Adineta ricciae TaxID=249248 RepID=A0A813QP99_ADIRI|nr:unnamed protein product [Adineta ricciae]